MNNKEPKKILLGFLHPSLFGAYVLAGMVSAFVFYTNYSGYGCYYRVGGLLFLFFIPVVFVLLIVVVLSGWVQKLIWSRLLKLPTTRELEMPLPELFLRACLVMTLVLPLAAKLGGIFPELKAKKNLRRLRATDRKSGTAEKIPWFLSDKCARLGEIKRVPAQTLPFLFRRADYERSGVVSPQGCCVKRRAICDHKPISMCGSD